MKPLFQVRISFFFLKLARIHLTQSIWVNFITLTARQNTRSVRGVDPVHLLSISSRIIRSNNEEFLIRVQQRTITSSATTKGNALGKLRISDRLFGDEVPWHKEDREVKDTPVFRSAFFCRFCYNTRIHFLCLNKKLGCRSILLYARVKKNVTLCQKKPGKKEANNMIGNKTNKTEFFSSWYLAVYLTFVYQMIFRRLSLRIVITDMQTLWSQHLLLNPWQESNFLQVINILSGMRLMRLLLRIYREHKN